MTATFSVYVRLEVGPIIQITGVTTTDTLNDILSTYKHWFMNRRARSKEYYYLYKGFRQSLDTSTSQFQDSTWKKYVHICQDHWVPPQTFMIIFLDFLWYHAHKNKTTNSNRYTCSIRRE
jgi:hypothetical protein